MTKNLCNAKIKINERVYTCECEEMHESHHIARVRTDSTCYHGFSWDIDDTGTVILEMPDVVSHTILSWESRELWQPEEADDPDYSDGGYEPMDDDIPF